MAQKTVVTYLDDLTGKESDEIGTYTILINGAGVEIDLAPDSYDKLLKSLEPFLAADGARRVRGASSKAKARRTQPEGGTDAGTLRAWAKENGYEVNSRGRVSSVIREAYTQAH